MDDLKKTCLYDNHVALKAQMSPFGGFMMPIQYSSIIDEHNAVRQRVGMFDVSHMGEIFVTGDDAERFVNHIFTNDVTALPAGKILYGMMLYPDGGVVDDLLVYKMAEPKTWLLVVNAANIDKDDAWIREQAKDFNVEIDNASPRYGQIALQGPDAEKTAAEVLGMDLGNLAFYTFEETEWHGNPVIASRTGYTGEDGFEFYATPDVIVTMWEKLIAAGGDAVRSRMPRHAALRVGTASLRTRAQRGNLTYNGRVGYVCETRQTGVHRPRCVRQAESRRNGEEGGGHRA